MLLRDIAHPVQSGDIDAVIAALNASRLDRLVIALDTFYVPNHRSYVLRRFFDTLDSQGLRYLCVLDTLEACTVPSVAAFLRSTRSSSLQALIVNGYTLDLAHAEVVAAALEGNTSLRSLCFGKCWSNGRWCVCLKSDGYGPAHNRMEYAPVAEVLKRNRAAGAELRRAIEAVLTPARVLFRAHENIPRIQVTSASDDEGDSATPTTPRPFPILRLPSHILTLVLEHCGDDGLTKPQFRALLHVAGSDTAPKVRHRAVSLELARGRKLSDVRDELYARVLGSS